MSHRSADLSEDGDLLLRSPPETLWTTFACILAGLHGSFAGIAFWHGRWEGIYSTVLCGVFLVAAFVVRHIRSDITLLRSPRLIRLRRGVGPIRFDRYVPFAAITGVRVTLIDEHRPETCDIELLCYDDDIHCPPSAYPRQEALLLAMTLGVPLTKVYGDRIEPERERVNASV